jgi:GYF domain 2
MAVEWFYTTNKQQMGPVTWNELRELAEVGILKPHDLVWSDGMDEWVKAINQSGLFADGDAEEKKSPGKKASYTQPKPPPGRRTAPKDEDEDDEEDSKEAKKKARKKQEDSAKTKVGLKVGLILAGVVVVLLLLGCGVIGLIAVTVGFGGPERPTFPAVNNLGTRLHIEKRFDFKQNQRVTITAVNVNNPNMDVRLMVFRGNDLKNPIQQSKQMDLTSRVDFVAPANDSYMVRFANFDARVVEHVDVTITAR